MFGILCLTVLDPGERGRSLTLRLFPHRGMGEEDGLFRMARYPVVTLTLSPRWKAPLRENRVRRALLRLRSRGADSVILPGEYHGLARGLGLRPLTDLAAREAGAQAAVEELCRALDILLGSLGIEIRGGTLSRRAADQVLGLAQSAGALRIPEGENAELSRTLWRACGVIAQGEFPRGMPRLTLAFAGAAGESPGVMADLGAGLPENAAQVWRPQPLPPRGAMERMPAGCDPGVFAAALLECGALRPREIRVSRLDIPGDTPYNNEIVKE